MIKINDKELSLPKDTSIVETIYYFNVICVFDNNSEVISFIDKLKEIISLSAENTYVFTLDNTKFSEVYFLNTCHRINENKLEIVFVKRYDWISNDLSALVKDNKTTPELLIREIRYIENYKIVNNYLVKYKLNRFELPEEATQRKFKVLKLILTDDKEIDVNGHVKEVIVDFGER